MSPAHRLVTISLVALVTIIAFEAMAISTAMPIIARDLDAVRSYGLAFSAMLTTQLLGIVLAGVWCDRRGPLPSLFAGQAPHGRRHRPGRPGTRRSRCCWPVASSPASAPAC